MRRIGPWAGLPLSLLLLGFGLTGCSGEDELDGLYLLAVQALGSDAFQGREAVINPFHMSAGNPEVPKGALRLLGEAGYQLMGPGGEEDPEKVTVYFLIPELLDDGGYEIRVQLSFGDRPGTKRRRTSRWGVIADCPDQCVLRETIPFSPGG